MTIPATLAVGLHSGDAEVTDLQKAVLAFIAAFPGGILAVANGGTAVAAKSSGQAHLTVATTCVNGVPTVINYDTVDEDTDAAITTGVAWKFTCKKAGQYHLSASAGLGIPAAGGVAFIGACLNGTEVKRGFRCNFLAAETVTLVVACDLQLALNDFVDVRLFQNSGAGVATETVALVNHFSIFRVPGS